MGWKCRSWPTHFFAHNFLSVNILSNVVAAYFVFFVWHTVLDDIFQIVACFLYCKLEQCSAINNLSIASALLLSKSDLCNLKFCVTFVGMQKLLYSYLSSFATSYAFYAHIVSLWLHYCKLRNRLFLNYRLFSRMGSRTIGTEPTCKFWILQSYMSKLLAALVYQEVFYQILLLTSITEPLGNIVPWDKNIFYQCCL